VAVKYVSSMKIVGSRVVTEHPRSLHEDCFVVSRTVMAAVGSSNGTHHLNQPLGNCTRQAVAFDPCGWAVRVLLVSAPRAAGGI
jgi:hypothetical protein